MRPRERRIDRVIVQRDSGRNLIAPVGVADGIQRLGEIEPRVNRRIFICSRADGRAAYARDRGKRGKDPCVVNLHATNVVWAFGSSLGNIPKLLLAFARTIRQ